MDHLRAPGLVNVGWRGVGVQHQVGLVRFAALGEVHHVASPVHAALGAEPGLIVIGRLDPILARAAPRSVRKPTMPPGPP